MSYITRVPIQHYKLSSSHPKVMSIWDFGSMPANLSSSATYNIGIMLMDGSRKDFSGEDADKVLADAEAYLEALT